MVRITFVRQDGQRQSIDAEAGESLMANAKARGVEGIVAECGGSMVCGTCHVYLDPGIHAQLGPVPAMEAEMLEYVIDPQPCSRLACQVRVSAEMEGMEVGVPRSQH